MMMQTTLFTNNDVIITEKLLQNYINKHTKNKDKPGKIYKPDEGLGWWS
jgi:hypothetical protein